MTGEGQEDEPYLLGMPLTLLSSGRTAFRRLLLAAGLSSFNVTLGDGSHAPHQV